MKKTYKVKNNQTFDFNAVKTDKKYSDTRKNLMTEKFNNDLNIKKLSTWEFGKPKKLVESKVFDYLSDDVSPIKENKEATDFLNKLHFVEDRKANRIKYKTKDSELAVRHSVNTRSKTKVEDIPASYYLVQLKNSLDYLSFNKFGDVILTKNKNEAEMFTSKEEACDAIEEFIFHSIDSDFEDFKGSVEENDYFDSVEAFVADSKSDFIIKPVYDKELSEASKRFFKRKNQLEEKSVRSVTNDVAFYIVTVLSNGTIKYIGKDDDDNFIIVDYKDLSEAFEDLSDAREAIDDMIYQELNDIDFDLEDMAEQEKYNELYQNYNIEAVYIDPETLYFKTLN